MHYYIAFQVAFIILLWFLVYHVHGLQAGITKIATLLEFELKRKLANDEKEQEEKEKESYL